MANYSTLKAAVADVVKTNGTQAITGANLQSVLLSIINSVGGGGYIFKGVATPSTDAGTPDENVFYVGGAGTYANFGTSVTVPVGSICVFKYNGSWSKDTIDCGVQQALNKITRLDSEVIGEAGTFDYDCASNYVGMYFNGTSIVASGSTQGIVIPVEKSVTYSVQNPEPEIYNARFTTSYPTIGGSSENANAIRTGYTPSSDGYVLISMGRGLKTVNLTKTASGIKKDISDIEDYEIATDEAISIINGKIETVNSNVEEIEESSVFNISSSEVKAIESNVFNETGELLTLPIINGDSYGKFTGVSGKIYTGAANYVRLLLPVGSVTYNGVTLSIDKDGWVTMTGTASSAGGVISYTNLKGYADADTAKADITIPSMPSLSYKLGLVQKGTSSKATIYVRSATASSWLALLSTSNLEATIDMSSVGAFVAYLIAGTTYNEHFRFMIMPSAIRETITLQAFVQDDWSVDIETIEKDGIHIANYTMGDGTATNIEKLLPVTNYATNGINCLWFGDSLSELSQVVALTGNKLATNIINVAEGGAPFTKTGLSKWYDTGVESLVEQKIANNLSPAKTALATQLSAGDITQERYTRKLSIITAFENVDMSEIHKVIIFAGTNDLNSSTLTIADFKNGVSNTLTNIFTEYQHIQVYCITPPYRTDGDDTRPNGLVLSDLVDAIKEVCASFGVPCLNLLSNGGINSANSTYWLEDGLHLSNNGAEMLSTRFANWLSSTL